MDGDGTELLAAGATNVRFDMDGDGRADDTSWFGSGDAILFLDRDGNRTVSSAREFSFVEDVENARSDLAGLAAFDSNKDGRLTSADARFADFRLWQDRNGDGVAAAAEISTLAAAKVAGIGLAGTPTNVTAAPGSAVAINTGSFVRDDGTRGMLADAALTYFATGATAAAEASIALAHRSFSKKSDKYQIVAEGGRLFVTLKKAKGTVDPASGMIGPATMLSFGKTRIGMLAPIVLDLDGDGVELRSRGDSNARFDMDGDGSRDDTGWVGKGDGFLVIDRNGDGAITTAAELSFLAEKPDARSDLEALAALDSNRDGKVDASDLRFSELRVWIDRNGNGVTDGGELRTLQEQGIASILLAASTTKQTVKAGQNVLLATGTFTLTDGSVHSLGDAALAFRPAGAGGAAARAESADERASRLASVLQSGSDPYGELAELARLAEGVRQDVPSLALLARDPEDSGAAQLPADPRLALMTQDMAAFGALRGEIEWRARGQSEGTRLDYFA